MSRRDERRARIEEQLGELGRLRAYMVETDHGAEQFVVLDEVIRKLEAELEDLRPATVWERLLRGDHQFG